MIKLRIIAGFTLTGAAAMFVFGLLVQGMTAWTRSQNDIPPVFYWETPLTFAAVGAAVGLVAVTAAALFGALPARLDE